MGCVKDKYNAEKPETIDGLKDNIRENIGEKQMYTIDNVLKNWTDRKTGLTERIVLSNKKKEVLTDTLFSC